MLPAHPVSVLVVGAGGREHALCWKLSGEEHVQKIYCAPGNGGTATTCKVENIDVSVMDFAGLAQFAMSKKIDLVVIGPDNPLAEGIVDYLEDHGIRCFGPRRESARLEWSKAYAKEFMARHSIATAKCLTAGSLAEASQIVKDHLWARVIKVDGLALGKGVFVCDREEEALHALEAIFTERRFGQSGAVVLLEERLQGEELSLLTFCDGKRLVPMVACQDHKRRFDNDEGPNTGGMGAYAPVALYESHRVQIEDKVLKPIERALASRELQYQGVLYIGLMITPVALGQSGEQKQGQSHQPYVLEFNCRFGDPETQTILPLMESPLTPVLWSCTEGALDDVKISWSPYNSCCVVAVAESYPEGSSRDQILEVKPTDHAIILHAGTKLVDGKLLTNGGRIVSATGLAPSMPEARRQAYQGLQSVKFASMSYRTDIAWRAVQSCRSL